ncbi:MAG: two-component system, chemotaxis family, sensor kinase CheA [Thermoanaerobaculia bacterium]|jgi:two-component system chemotaxis sensor kinase CheA|nr:two-component system, chemotaxis family, sensor kinase CheA [Thermoanaerobaculia bacterium]
MSKEDDRALNEFTGEAEELLDTLSRDLVELEAQGRDVRPEVINKIFREVHSLKGLAGMLGFAEISELSHTLEDMLDRLRMGKIEITRDLIDLLYDSVDSLNRLVIAINDPAVSGLVDLTDLTRRIHHVVTNQAQKAHTDPFAELTLDEQTKKSLTEYEEHRLVENVRGRKHILSVEVRFDFSDFDEKLRALTELLSQTGEVISTLPAIDSSGGAGIAFRLLYGSTLDAAAVTALVPEGSVTSLRTALPETVEAAVALPEAAEEDLSLRSISQTVRVDISKLDHVMNIVGELIIEKTQLDALTRSLHQGEALQQARLTAHELTKIARNFDRKLNELQKSVIETRMVPVGQIYAKLSRTVRKVARELNKEIELVLRGEDTELDKVMVEELTDPLMHIIRNALDHGIESAEERVRAGKNPIGRITLNAYQQGNSVVLDVTDDGRGIDPELVRKAAVKRNLVAQHDPFDQLRAYEMLFTPGFSTASAVSEISGRGVGLDVVKKNLQELKGTIDILSVRGEGSTFRIMLPITLAIIQALVVRAGGEQFAIPLTSVEESLRIYSRDIRTVERREVFTLRDFTLPLLRLADAFHLDNERDESPDAKWFVVVTRSGEKVAGILVDALVRQQEVVIKSIGERLKTIPGIAGATEVGEGEIVLVIDVGTLIEQFGGKAREMRAAVAWVP